jgi:hypothetical protein
MLIRERVNSDKILPKICKYRNTYIFNALHPIYSELGYSEYPLIVNGFLRTDR